MHPIMGSEPCGDYIPVISNFDRQVFMYVCGLVSYKILE